MKYSCALFILISLFILNAGVAISQCTNYSIELSSGTWPGEVSWSLFDENGVLALSGGAPYSGTICLEDGCYSLELSDTFGDGWNGAVLSIYDPALMLVSSSTLPTGSFQTDAIAFGSASCGAVGGCGYTINVSAGTFPTEVSWNLLDENGVAINFGAAPMTSPTCLATGCYTFEFFDSFGDGWNGSQVTITDPSSNIIYSGTLVNGAYSLEVFSVGGADCGNSSGNCPYDLFVGGGTWDTEISWTLVDDGGNPVANGFAPESVNLCLPDGCYTINMYDSFGDGWDGATYSLTDENGLPVSSGTLATGGFGTASIGINDSDCISNNSGPVTAGDCINAVDVCTDLDFTIDPNGSGSVLEIPTLGTVSNPDFPGGVLNPWGTTNMGCLRSGELNSTWMIVNIWETGNLEFTFGGLGTQAGYYDWSMWAYDPSTCQDIFNDVLPPLRCNWNGVSFGGTGLSSSVPFDGDPSNYEPPLNVIAGEQYLICFSNWSSVTTNVPLEFGGTATVGCGELLLPVTWLSFEGKTLSRGIELEWSTASEANNAHFHVERSKDGTSWEAIARMDGAGTSTSVMDYAFLDASPFVGLNYYRIAQEDINGEYSYSEQIAVPWLRDGLMIGPNPNHGEFSIFCDTRLIQSVEILDEMGRKMSFLEEVRPQEYIIKLTQAKAGLCMVKVELSQGKILSKRILVHE